MNDLALGGEGAPQPTRQIAAIPALRPFIGPEELARRSGQATLLRLGANESAFGPPPRALAAMRAALPQTSWYGDPEATELREALAGRHGCEVRNIGVASGIDELLGLAARAYLAEGDVSVSTLGTYPTYTYAATGCGARLETVPYAPDGSVQLEALAERAHEAAARIVYLANPDNPSASFAGREAVGRFARALPERALLLLDEAYGDFVPPAELLPESIQPRILRLRTFSKAYGLAGARIAYCIGAPEIVATFGKIRLQYGLNRTSQIGALEALGEQAFVAGVVAEVERGRADYRALAERCGLRALPSRTNFVCIDIGSRARAEALIEELLQRGIFIRKPGAAPLDGFVRVTVGTPPQRARFASAFVEALAALDEKAVVG